MGFQVLLLHIVFDSLGTGGSQYEAMLLPKVL